MFNFTNVKNPNSYVGVPGQVNPIGNNFALGTTGDYMGFEGDTIFGAGNRLTGMQKAVLEPFLMGILQQI